MPQNDDSQNDDYYRACDVCGIPFSEEEWDDRHTHHEPGCPFADGSDEDDFDTEEYSDLESAFDALLGRDCDLNYHPQCCPECNRPGEE